MPTVDAKKEGAPLSLPPLPYPEDALAPVISANALRLHHGKHHQAYIAKVNELVAGPELEGQTRDRIVLATSGRPERVESSGIELWAPVSAWESRMTRSAALLGAGEGDIMGG